MTTVNYLPPTQRDEKTKQAWHHMNKAYELVTELLADMEHLQVDVARSHRDRDTGTQERMLADIESVIDESLAPMYQGLQDAIDAGIDFNDMQEANGESAEGRYINIVI